jgi:hypothetical protein
MKVLCFSHCGKNGGKEAGFPVLDRFWSLLKNIFGLSENVGSRTRDHAKAGPGLVKEIADVMILNQSKGKSGSYAHAARVGMQNHSKGKSLLHLTSLK